MARRKMPGLMAMGLSFLAQAGAPQTYYAFVFSGPKPGMEAEYNRWYSDEHAPDVVSVPGFVSAQRFVRSAVQLRANAGPSPAYLVLYKIVTDDLGAVYAEVNRRAANGQTRMSQSIAMNSGMNYTYRLTPPAAVPAPRTPSGARTGPERTYCHIVFSDSAPGQEEALDRWYAEAHGPDMMRLPDMTGYWLGVRSAVQMTPDASAPRHLALFQMRTSDMGLVATAFGQEVPNMTRGPAMTTVWGYTYEAIGPEILGDQVRAQRAAAGHASLGPVPPVTDPARPPGGAGSIAHPAVP